MLQRKVGVDSFAQCVHAHLPIEGRALWAKYFSCFSSSEDRTRAFMSHKATMGWATKRSKKNSEAITSAAWVTTTQRTVPCFNAYAFRCIYEALRPWNSGTWTHSHTSTLGILIINAWSKLKALETKVNQMSFFCRSTSLRHNISTDALL